MDFEWHDFVKLLFSMPPCDPHTYSSFEVLDNANMISLFGYMLLEGCKNLYKKEPSQLDEDEMKYILKYFHSIGIDVSYKDNNIYFNQLKNN